MLNLAAIHEAISEAIPDHECLVFRDRRYTWRQVQDRTRRLAAVLEGAGLGCHAERASLENWESGQDHVALYLHNGNEYLEGMVGAFKARCAPFNVNYRYVEEELVYLFENADAKAVVFHAAFAPTIEKVRAHLPHVRLWLEVEDGSGNHLEGAVAYEEALAAATPSAPRDLSPDDLYILYTGGTTGMPKGVLWRQEEILKAALMPPRTEHTLDAVVARATRRAGQMKALPTPPFMHGAAHWAAFTMWHVGGTIFVQDNVAKLDSDDIWGLVEREGITAMTLVGDAFAQPLLEGLRKGQYDVSSIRSLSSGGAILTARVKDELLSFLPGARIMDVLGSSESGHQATQVSLPGEKATTGDFELGEGNAVLNEAMTDVLPLGSGAQGWLARTGPMPLGYYKDPEKTARTFPEVAGVRYSVPGDRAVARIDGGVDLLGRDSVTINSGGEKIFAEEVEHALKHHPDVYDAVVTATPHDRWGQQVTAVVALRAGSVQDEASLLAECERHIARYKFPREFVFVDEVLRAPSGKADYRWAKSTAFEALGIAD